VPVLYIEEWNKQPSMEVLMSCLSYFLLACFFLFVTQSLQATIIHVPADSSTIQGGINGAVDGDTVMVAPGTYHEHDIDFFGKAITVMGTDPEDSIVVAATIVDGDSLGRVFNFHSGEDTMSHDECVGWLYRYGRVRL
jgi:hypothetical protein